MLRKCSFAMASLSLFMLLAPPRRDFAVAHSVPNPATWKGFQFCLHLLADFEQYGFTEQPMETTHKTPTISHNEIRHKAPQHLVLVEASTRPFSSWLPWCLAKPLKTQWLVQIQEFLHVILFIGIRSPQFGRISSIKVKRHWGSK